MKKNTFQNPYSVLGLGKTGISCIRFLVNQGHAVTVMDTREEPPGLSELRTHWPDVPVILGGLDPSLLMQAKELIVSPGLSLQEPAIANAMAAGVPAIGDIELFARHAHANIVAITGSNAKSTVTTLVGEMAKRAGFHVGVGGNLGIPALDLLDQKTADIYVLELSSFQLETTHSLSTLAATILNISADHLDRYPSMTEYVAAKQRIYQRCQTAVYNREDPQTYPTTKTPTAINFGLQSPQSGEFGLLQHEKQLWLARGFTPLLAISEVRIKGRHNIANALAALALGSAMQLPMNAMLETLRDFAGLPHRCQWIAETHGIHWYNDSKGTNIGATLAAIEGLGNDVTGKLVLILGGLGKGADFTLLRKVAQNYMRSAILIGQDAPIIRQALQGTIELTDAKDMANAVQLAHAVAKSGDAVLLSPACASLDMFDNFEHRGNVFIQEVEKIVSQGL